MAPASVPFVSGPLVVLTALDLRVYPFRPLQTYIGRELLFPPEAESRLLTALGLQMHIPTPGFTRVLGISIQVLTLVSHLPSPSFP